MNEIEEELEERRLSMFEQEKRLEKIKEVMKWRRYMILGEVFDLKPSERGHELPEHKGLFFDFTGKKMSEEEFLRFSKWYDKEAKQGEGIKDYIKKHGL